MFMSGVSNISDFYRSVDKNLKCLQEISKKPTKSGHRNVKTTFISSDKMLAYIYNRAFFRLTILLTLLDADKTV